MEKLIALQDQLGLGHKGKVIITTQGRIDENKPWIAELPSSEIGAAMSLIDHWNEHDTLKAKAELFDEFVYVSHWINKFISTSCDGGDAWCSVREHEGSSDWAERLDNVLSKAKEIK